MPSSRRSCANQPRQDPSPPPSAPTASFAGLARIPRQYFRIPADQKALLEREDAWSTDGHPNIPTSVLKQVKRFHARQRAASPPRSPAPPRPATHDDDRSAPSHAGSAASPTSAASWPSSPAAHRRPPSRERSDAANAGKHPPVKPTAAMEPSMTWSSSPESHLRPPECGVPAEKRPAEDTSRQPQPQLPLHLEPSAAPQHAGSAALARRNPPAHFPLPQSSIASSEVALEVEAPQANIGPQVSVNIAAVSPQKAHRQLQRTPQHPIPRQPPRQVNASQPPPLLSSPNPAAPLVALEEPVAQKSHVVRRSSIGGIVEPSRRLDASRLPETPPPSAQIIPCSNVTGIESTQQPPVRRRFKSMKAAFQMANGEDEEPRSRPMKAPKPGTSPRGTDTAEPVSTNSEDLALHDDGSLPVSGDFVIDLTLASSPGVSNACLRVEGHPLAESVVKDVQQEASSSNSDPLPRNGRPSQSLFDAYKIVYYDYRGTLDDFLRAVIYLKSLWDKNTIHPSLFDDFIRVFPMYVAYTKSLPEGERPLVGLRWYNKTVLRPEYMKGVLKHDNIDHVLGMHEAEVQLIREALENRKGENAEKENIRTDRIRALRLEQLRLEKQRLDEEKPDKVKAEAENMRVERERLQKRKRESDTAGRPLPASGIVPTPSFGISLSPYILGSGPLPDSPSATPQPRTTAPPSPTVHQAELASDPISTAPEEAPPAAKRPRLAQSRAGFPFAASGLPSSAKLEARRSLLGSGPRSSRRPCVPSAGTSESPHSRSFGEGSNRPAAPPAAPLPKGHILGNSPATPRSAVASPAVPPSPSLGGSTTRRLDPAARKRPRTETTAHAFAPSPVLVAREPIPPSSPLLRAPSQQIQQRQQQTPQRQAPRPDTWEARLTGLPRHESTRRRSRASASAASLTPTVTPTRIENNRPEPLHKRAKDPYRSRLLPPLPPPPALPPTSQMEGSVVPETAVKPRPSGSSSTVANSTPRENHRSTSGGTELGGASERRSRTGRFKTPVGSEEPTFEQFLMSQRQKQQQQQQLAQPNSSTRAAKDEKPV